MKVPSILLAICLAATLFLGACARTATTPPRPAAEAPITAKGEAAGDRLIVFYAASLALPFKYLEQAFERGHLGVDMQGESSGSQTACRKITELNRECDVISSADYEVIEQLLIPDHASWFIIFARNAEVIAYTDKSKYGDEVNAQNWYRVLLRPDVRVGRCDPNLAPEGYRTLLTWQLADIYYKDDLKGEKVSDKLLAAVRKEHVTQSVTELLPLLESMALDYAFMYKSVAMQHNLRFVTLPPQIDLSSEQYLDFYRQAKVEVTGKKPGETMTMVGAPILYGITIPNGAPHPELAMDFVRLLLSKKGQEALRKGFQEPTVPALAPNVSAVPEELRPLVKQAEI